MCSSGGATDPVGPAPPAAARSRRSARLEALQVGSLVGARSLSNDTACPSGHSNAPSTSAPGDGPESRLAAGWIARAPVTAPEQRPKPPARPPVRREAIEPLGPRREARRTPTANRRADGLHTLWTIRRLFGSWNGYVDTAGFTGSAHTVPGAART
jgi:hypothetical protein